MYPAVESRRVVEAQAAVHEVFSAPPPREVPVAFWKAVRSPIAYLFMFLGALFAVQGIVFAAFGLLESPLAAIPSLVIVGVSLVELVASVKFQRGIRKTLSDGLQYKGRVVAVKPLPARINQKTFFRVRVRFEGPDGREVIGKDTVTNFEVEFFLRARDEEKDVDVLYRPNARNRVILTQRIGMASLFD